MALLNTGQKNKIRAAIQKVTDTFMVTPVDYHIAGQKFDRFSEDNKQKNFYSFHLNGLVEHDEDSIQESPQGTEFPHKIKISFNLEDLEKKGLITTDFKPIFNASQDFVSVRAQIYQVNSVILDGPLDEKDVLVVVKAELNRNSLYKFGTFIDNGSQIPVDERLSGELVTRIENLETRLNNLAPGALNFEFMNISTKSITHNLGRYVDVMIVDNNGDEIEGEVEQPTLNTVIINFTQNQSGTIIIS